jgi:RNA polymerase sigma-70 factor, ECF subfamily
LLLLRKIRIFCSAADANWGLNQANQMAASTSKQVTEHIMRDEMRLISRILAGEGNLYYDLIAPYERMVYVSAFSILRNEFDAEDCTQDAFLKAFRHLSEFKGESKFGSWLVRITLNEAKMRLRKVRTEPHESLDQGLYDEEGEYIPHTLGDWRDIPSEVLERKEFQKLLQDAVNSLPEKYREVFVLRDIQGLDVATSAEILGVSSAVIKTRLVRARLQLRDLLMPVVKDSNVVSRRLFRKGKNPWP